MRILAIETATAACSVAVTDGERVLAELTLEVPRAHSTRLMPLVAQAVSDSGLAKTDLDLIAVGVGPGSFTGLRIGLATAKGLAFALDKPCVGVPTLKSLAYGTGAQMGLVLPVLDAKRGQVYAAAYVAGDRDPATWAEVVPTGHYDLPTLAEKLREIRTGLRHSWQFVTLCGDAAATVAQGLGPEFGEVVRVAAPGLTMPRGWAVAAVGRSLLAAGAPADPDALLPVYLRKSEAETLWEARK